MADVNSGYGIECGTGFAGHDGTCVPIHSMPKPAFCVADSNDEVHWQQQLQPVLE
jgi:hypothetical protein